MTAADLFTTPKVLADAKKELLSARGPNFKYRAMLGDRAPALDYRKAASGSNQTKP